MKKMFDENRRIRLGIWGLGRGRAFAGSADFLNIDVVAGCDFDDDLRKIFASEVPGAFCTADENEFLAMDMDAVLIATFFTGHTDHIIKVLESGKHVICEVTPFQTPADAVRVIEAVEKSGKIFHLLENYPFSPEYMYMQKRYAEGFFGEFQYGEFEYLHECRGLCYVKGNKAAEPGYSVHHWRSALNPHYYCTHSLGPVMYITGLRPETVSAMHDEVILPGFLDFGEWQRHASAAPSMIKMSNGSLVRNLMGATTNDFPWGMRFWGTKASAHRGGKGNPLHIRFGGFGSGLLTEVKPELDEVWKFAIEQGHGGGDFWELYFFAREFFYGEKGFWDVYRAADVTLAGIMACRSQKQNGIPVRIPDLRNQEERELYRDDHEVDVPDFDPEDIFPAGHENEVAGKFSRTMLGLYGSGLDGLNLLSLAYSGMSLYEDICDPEIKLKVRDTVNKLIIRLPEICRMCEDAREIMEMYPDSVPGRTIAGVFASFDMEKVFDTEKTIAELQKWSSSMLIV